MTNHSLFCLKAETPSAQMTNFVRSINTRRTTMLETLEKDAEGPRGFLIFSVQATVVLHYCIQSRHKYWNLNTGKRVQTIADESDINTGII